MICVCENNLKMNTAVIKAVQTIAKKRLIKMVRATKLTKEDSNHRNLAVRLLMFEERLGHPLHDFLRNHWYLATHSLIDPYLSFIIIFVLSLASILFATSSACITSKIWFLIYGPTKWLFSCTDYTVINSMYSFECWLLYTSNFGSLFENGSLYLAPWKSFREILQRLQCSGPRYVSKWSSMWIPALFHAWNRMMR